MDVAGALNTSLGQLKNATDIIDMDQFYIPAFVQRLALRCGEAFAVSSETLARVKQTDEELMALALSYDDEGVPIKISPNRRV